MGKTVQHDIQTQESITQTRILIDQMQRLAAQTLVGTSATALNSSILAFVLLDVIPARKVALWIFAFLSVCLVRILIHLYYKKRPLAPGQVGQRKALLLVLLSLSGCMWGAAPVFLFPYSSMPHQIVMAFVMGGMVAGSVGVFASIMPSFYVFTIPNIFPLIIVFFAIGDRLHTAMGCMLTIFAFFMFLAAIRLNQEIRNFLVRKHENINLIASLEKEVKERQGAEKELTLRNQQIEFIVAERTAELREANKKLLEQKKLEMRLQRARKMEVLGTMAGGVAHDLNNILSGIVSYPDLLLMQIPADSTLRKPIQVMKESGKKAAAIVQDLLTLTRRGVMVDEVLNLNHIIRDYLESPEHEKLMTFHPAVEISPHLEQNLLDITGSGVHLIKTIMNLVANAAEAMPEGGVIRINTANRYLDQPVKGYDHIEEGDFVVMTVEDTGIGIAPSDIERIFEPFYTKKIMGRSGTGLGMAVVWGTVKDHKGYIDVSSVEGRGSRFSLYFPVTRRQRGPVKDQDPIASYYGNGESILLVDDVEEQRQIASDMLTQLSYQVQIVSSGEEAVNYLEKNKADIIVLDMIMDPGMDGLDTYKKILELHPGQKAIIASGFSETERVREAIRLGAGPYIKKPYTWLKLGQAVQAALNSNAGPPAGRKI